MEFPSQNEVDIIEDRIKTFKKLRDKMTPQQRVKAKRLIARLEDKKRSLDFEDELI